MIDADAEDTDAGVGAPITEEPNKSLSDEEQIFQIRLSVARVEVQQEADGKRLDALDNGTSRIIELLENRGSNYRLIITTIGDILSNKNGQLKYLAAIIIVLSALAFGVPMALSASGVTVGQVSDTIEAVVTPDGSAVAGELDEEVVDDTP